MFPAWFNLDSMEIIGVGWNTSSLSLYFSLSPLSHSLFGVLYIILHAEKGDESLIYFFCFFEEALTSFNEG